MLKSIRWLVVGALALLVSGPLPARGADEPKGKICYARKDGAALTLHVMDADGKNDRALPNQPDVVNLAPAWSPDGTMIAFMSGGVQEGMEFGLYVIGADGSGRKRLAENEKLAAMPAWSPDGKSLLLSVDRHDAPALMVINADGTGARPLETGLPFTFAAGFSPDGKEIVFTAADNARDPRSAEIHVAKADGKEARKLTTGGGPAIGGAGAWSPDGKTVAYVRMDLGARTAELHTWSLAEKADKKLMDLKLGDGRLFQTLVTPAWSPDSRWLVLSQPADDGAWSLWRISPDGQTKERLTPAGTDCHFPAWSAK